ncbi:OmpA family protein [Hymenobacter nivis]|uniref:OmpA family protein n=1 Tax=Hymenobacter nivis TaxID=1850093 RepID=A0A502GD96_9BACT|nr:OmpA family protein [Hymenobacter nivis]TPG58683.1 OmpA family protein [Hymenobacter nivis]
MADFLGTVKDLFSNELTGGAAAKLGESEGAVQKALGGIVPLVLGALIGRSGTPGGAQETLAMSQQAYQTTGSSLSAPGGLLGLLSGGAGGGLLSSLFGNAASTNTLTSTLGDYAGVSSASAGSLLGMAGPAILGLLGQHASTNNLDANGLSGMLQGLKSQVTAMLPSGLSSLAGLVGLGGLGAAASNVASGLGAPLAAAVPPVANPARTPLPEPAPAGGSSRWPLILLALAVIAGLFYFLRGRTNDAPAAATPTADTTVVGPADTTRTLGATAGAALDSAEMALKAGWAKLGTVGELKLADGTALRVPANGVEKRLVAFIDDKDKAVDKTTWFSLDRLLFQTGTSDLLPDSQEQLANVAAILKAYPAVKLKLGGYTDSRGNAAANLKLSGQRAAAVKAQLEGLGVASGRLDSEGYGVAHPVASNDTPDGRQQNRRVDVRVTAK